MSAATITINPVQPALFEIAEVTAAPEYTEADRQSDRIICRTYLKQWTSSFKKDGGTIVLNTITIDQFTAAARRLEQ